MAPKASSGKAKASTIDEKESLQAILFADSFDKQFEPLTVTTPRVRPTKRAVDFKVKD